MDSALNYLIKLNGIYSCIRLTEKETATTKPRLDKLQQSSLCPIKAAFREDMVTE
jgi:hypothetical protein